MARAAHLRDEALGYEALVIEDDSSGGAATSLDLPVTTSIDLTRDAAIAVATHLGRLLAT